MSRCVNSMTVASAGPRGIATPLQSGQWSPQPAPEPEARTKAPQRMTSRVKTSTPHV